MSTLEGQHPCPAVPLIGHILVHGFCVLLEAFTPCSGHALSHAKWLAREGGELHLLHVIEGAEGEPSARYAALDSAYGQLCAAAASEVRHEAAAVRGVGGVFVRTHVERAPNAAPAI